MFVAWQNAKPTNFFTSDQNLQRTLEFYDGAEMYRSYVGRLYKFGAAAAHELNQAVIESNKTENLPRLDRYDDFGKRIESVDYHPAYHEAGRIIYGAGAMSVHRNRGNNTLALAIHYLSSQNGEAGHNCPLACTAGVIKTLQAVGLTEDHAALAEVWLEKMLDENYDSNFTGAQFLTEVQGGADVGANGTVATDNGDGTWVLNGEKWFCSNVSADLALVTARVPGQGDGSRGLGLFLVPKTLADGTQNGMKIQRLKDKLGTRSLATAEVVYDNALAYQVGDTANGIKNVMEHVINVSRLYNASSVAGMARRAYIEAWYYAQNRWSFGEKIISYPLVQDVLAKMHTDSNAIASGTFHIARLVDDMEINDSTDADLRAVIRTAINLNKYRSSVIAHEVINHGIEILGGNGAIESFSVLPRLLRDNVVCENWEGPHNVLMAQVQRDFRRYAHHLPFIERVRNMFKGLRVENLKREGLAEVERISAELDAILALPELEASVYFRPLMDRLTDLFYTGCMAVEGSWENLIKQDRTKQRLAEFYFNRRVVKKPLAQWTEYPTWVSKLCHDIRPRQINWAEDQWEGMDDPIWE